MTKAAKSSSDITEFRYIIQELFDLSETLESIENRGIQCKLQTTVKRAMESRSETIVTEETQWEAGWNIILEITDTGKDRDSRTQGKPIHLKRYFKYICSALIWHKIYDNICQIYGNTNIKNQKLM